MHPTHLKNVTPLHFCGLKSTLAKTIPTKYRLHDKMAEIQAVDANPFKLKEIMKATETVVVISMMPERKRMCHYKALACKIYARQCSEYGPVLAESLEQA
jgi:hypothetical protein